MISRLEIKRQLVHLVLATSIALLYFFDMITVPLMTIFAFVATLIYYINKTKPIRILKPFLSNLEREKNKKHKPGFGAVTLLVGISLAMILFPKDVALAAIIILALGDSIAPLIGHYGVIAHPLSRDKEKLLEGCIAGFVVGFIGASFFVSTFEAFIASLFAMIFEAIEVRVYGKIDDNIIMPLVAGAIIVFLRML